MEKQNRKKSILKCVLLGVLGLMVVGYVGTAVYFRVHFYPNTLVGEDNISGKTKKETISIICDGLNGYELRIQERGNETESILGAAIGLAPNYGSFLEDALANQSGFGWPKYLFVQQQIGNVPMKFQQELLAEEMSRLKCLKKTAQTAPENAYLEYSNGKYEIIPEVMGTTINKEKMVETISAALESREKELNLEEEDCYVNPEITSESQELKQGQETANTYLTTKITYDDGNAVLPLAEDDISKMLQIGSKGEVEINEQELDAFVQKVDMTYSTCGKSKKFKTSYGKIIEIARGDYGWQVDKKKEKKALKKALKNQKVETRKPKYAKEAASRGTYDYGNSYVEINLTAQHLFVYVKGKLVLESDFVSGNESAGMQTRLGMSSLKYKERNATLRGDDYETPVSFWMPFDGGIGMHDATWRSRFGGNIYKNSGSHGCINLPLSIDEKIFEYVYPGEPIVVYKLPGTEPVEKVDKEKAKEKEKHKKTT